MFYCEVGAPWEEEKAPLLGGTAMRLLTLLAVMGVFASAAAASVSVDIYLADEMTPLALADPNKPRLYRDIMVGTKLTVFVSSDSEQDWDGMIWFSAEYASMVTFSGRDYMEDEYGVGNYVGSCLEPAGILARAYPVEGSRGFGVDLLGAAFCTSGDWFVFDYLAQRAGAACLTLYGYGDDPNNPPDTDLEYFAEAYGLTAPTFVGQNTLIDLAMLNHVPSRDCDTDGVVDFVDFAVLASQWQQAARAEPNTAPSSDLDSSETVDIHDVALFCEYWLERTDVNVPPADPNNVVDGP